MKTLFSLLLIPLLSCSLFLPMLFASPAFAQSDKTVPPTPSPAVTGTETPTAPATPSTTPTARTGIPIGDTGLPSNLPRLGLSGSTDPVAVTESFLLKYIIRPIFFISGGVAIIVIMYSGFQIITARGEEEGIRHAKTTLTWAFAGLALVMLAYTIVSNLASIILKLS